MAFARTEEPRKLWCQLLPKLYIPEETDDAKVRALLVLVEALKEVSSVRRRDRKYPSVHG